MRYFVTSKLQKVTKSYKSYKEVTKKDTPICLKYSDLSNTCNLVSFVTLFFRY